MMKTHKAAYCLAVSLSLAGGCATLDFQKVPRAERKRFFELAAVSSQSLADQYAAMADSADREMFWQKFWKEKDPTPTTRDNERYQEHQRRVAYADTFFPQLIHFWDDRGKIYIKYGEPDYREVNPMGDALYSSDPFAGTDDINTRVGDEPVTIRRTSGTYGWEKWTYGQLAQTFSFLQKDVGYVLVSDLDAAKSGGYQSTIRSLQAIDAPIPTLSDTLPSDIYRHDYGQPLDFPFVLARFSSGEKSEVWVSYAVPLGKIIYDPASGRGLLNRSIVIFDENLAESAREESMLTPQKPGDEAEGGESQAVDLVKFILKPGGYNMAISLMDLNSGKTGIYKYRFSVIDYKAGAEETSDLMLSGDIRIDSGNGKFNRGGYRIIPQPGSAFKKGRDIYFYYELYNIRPPGAEPRTLQIRYLIFPKKGKQALSTQKQLITATSEKISLASGIATADLPPGEYILVAEVRDQNNNRVKNAARPFRIYK